MDINNLNYNLDKTIAEIHLSKEWILSRIKEEEIWAHYGVPLKKGLFCSPLRVDHHPTCSLYRSHNGRLIMKDFATGWSGDCFSYVSELHNSSFGATLRTIANDFDLISCPRLKKNVKKIEYKGEEIEESKTAAIQVQIQDFTETELKWWKAYGISPETLKKFRIYSCKNVFLNGNLFHLGNGVKKVFGYYGGIRDGIELWRCYFVGNKKFKFVANWPSSKIQGAHMLPKEGGENLIITKSLKDVCVLYEHGIPSIAPNSENIFVTDAQYTKLKEKFKNIYVLYDNDEPGIAGAEKIKEKYPDVKLIFIPKESECKDISDYRKRWGKEKTNELINGYLYAKDDFEDW